MFERAAGTLAHGLASLAARAFWTQRRAACQNVALRIGHSIHLELVGECSSRDRRALIGSLDVKKIDETLIRRPTRETQVGERSLRHTHVFNERADGAR